jgi:hypothetical protein
MLTIKQLQTYFYLSLILQLVLRFTTIYIHEIVYKGISFLHVYAGGFWLFIALPISIILGYFLIKKRRFVSWWQPLLLLLGTIMIVIGVNFIPIIIMR